MGCTSILMQAARQHAGRAFREESMIAARVIEPHMTGREPAQPPMKMNGWEDDDRSRHFPISMPRFHRRPGADSRAIHERPGQPTPPKITATTQDGKINDLLQAF